MFHSYVSTETIARRFIWQQLEQAVEKTKLASQSHSSAWGILYQWCEGQWKSLCCLLSSRECSQQDLWSWGWAEVLAWSVPWTVLRALLGRSFFLFLQLSLFSGPMEVEGCLPTGLTEAPRVGHTRYCLGMVYG